MIYLPIPLGMYTSQLEKYASYINCSWCCQNNNLERKVRSGEVGKRIIGRAEDFDLVSVISFQFSMYMEFLLDI